MTDASKPIDERVAMGSAGPVRRMKLRTPSYLVLGMLRLGARSGYAIKKATDVSTRFFWPTSLAQVYPELDRLERSGYVERREDPHGARARSAYEVTQAGEEALLAWLRTSSSGSRGWRRSLGTDGVLAWTARDLRRSAGDRLAIAEMSSCASIASARCLRPITVTNQCRRPHPSGGGDYRTAAGRSPVEEFIDGLSDPDAAAVFAAMLEVRNLGLRAARHLDGDVWEVRVDADRVIYRVLFAQEGARGQVLLALEAFNKKTQKTPRATIELAKRRLADWRRRGDALRAAAGKPPWRR
jgi:DNA-binding PadR family transcriptional regulator